MPTAGATYQPYDPSAGGPSQAAMTSTMAGQDAITSQQNTSDYLRNGGAGIRNFTGIVGGTTVNDKTGLHVVGGTDTGFGSERALSSSLGAQGNLYSGSGEYQKGQAETQFQNQQADLTAGFNRAQQEWKRNEAFAAIGLVL